MITAEITNLLVMYIVCGDRVETRVRSYADGHSVEEASVAFTQAALLENAVKNGRATWDETDILAVTGCDHWITDEKGALIATDIITPEIAQAPTFENASTPRGSLLEKLINAKRAENSK